MSHCPSRALFQRRSQPSARSTLCKRAAIHTSPIILCQPSETAFGKNLAAQLLASCKGGAPTSGTDNLAYLLPQAVGDVTKGVVTTEAGSPAVQKALQGKP